MVHNGIEYADIQLIAEAYDLLSHALNLGTDELSRIFAEWNEGDLESYLIQITSEVLAKRDRATGRPLVDVILDEAAQKGTGKWASQSALDLGIPVTAITEAVFARFLSALKEDRQVASRTLAGPNGAMRVAARGSLVDDVRSALYASKMVAYAQGFEQMQAASNEYGWDLKLGSIARIWRGGCIIRARFLNRITDAYAAEPGLKNLLLAPYFRDAMASAQDAWRRVLGVAIDRGIPVPAFSSSLAYYDAYRRDRLPANLVQGLRDYFGAHGYKRVDREGSFHTRWAQDGGEVRVGWAQPVARRCRSCHTTSVAEPVPALLFDLDGTLVDSVYQHVLAWHEVLGEAGMELSVWRIHRRIGMSGGLFVNALLRETGKQLSAEEASALRARHAEAFMRRLGEVRPLPGARDLLARLTRQNVPWAIATSGNMRTAGPSIELLGVKLKVIITRDDVAHAKPDPDLFLAAADRLGVDIANSIVFGDSVWDLLAAQRARALGVGLLSGGYGREELQQAGAYRVYEDPRDLLLHLDEVGVREQAG